VGVDAAVVSILIHTFFFSSRRRHTRSKRDWSSDVCSSDLLSGLPPAERDLVDLLALAGPTAVAALPADVGDTAVEGAQRRGLVEIGRAACRERGMISAVGGALDRRNCAL